MTEQNLKTANHKILVVDDDDAVRFAMQTALEFEGYEVFTAENGQAALDFLQHAPRPCVILLDLMMPVMDGWTFALQLEKDEKLADIPIVVVSAFGDQAQTINAKTIFKKPVNLKELFATVKKWCADNGGIIHG
ncbi:hypothetical protein CIK05_10340 [Bdellovibrio sp. qaytius]|nr:hypothetical protein CIK05_10340 [Bdellovibrio sp. qaytius]